MCKFVVAFFRWVRTWVIGEGLTRRGGGIGEMAGVRVTRVSSVYETAPQGVTEQPDFLNLVVEIETGLSAHELLALVKDLEVRLGRMAGRGGTACRGY